MTIGEKIKKLRQERGWSQKELAEKLGFLQPHINRWETNKYAPSLDALKKLSKLFDVSIDTLIFEEKDFKKFSLKNKSLAAKLKRLDSLSLKDQENIINIIESLLSKSA